LENRFRRKKILKLYRLLSVFLIAALAFSLLSQSVFAHERRTIGTYQAVVGWISEPAIEGQKNGIDFRVTNTATQQPVVGLEKTVQVEITHVSTGTVKVFDIEAVFGKPGAYTNNLIITSPGDYKFRFFGKIEDLSINETFSSSPTTFEGVDPVDDIQFPIKLTSAREVDSAVRGAETSSTQARVEAKNASDDAKIARTFAIVGIVIGAVGLATGLGALSASRKKN